MAAVHEAFPLRQCTPRLSPRRFTNACALAEMGRCDAPCEGGETVDAVRRARRRRPRRHDGRRPARSSPRSAAGSSLLADAERFEEAAVHRDRLAAFVRAAARLQRLVALTRCAELVAARPTPDGGWEVVRRSATAGWSRLPSRRAAPIRDPCSRRC